MQSTSVTKAMVYLDVSMHQVCVHAMRSTCSSVGVSCILKVIAACLESLLEHHALISCMAGMNGEVHLIVKHPASTTSRCC